MTYTYDAWGNPVSTGGTMAATLGAANPFRYKGYYYDVETGLYYLNSRYYNPSWGRFVSADSYGGSTGQLLSHNVFAYCANNPVMASDPSGHFWYYGNVQHSNGDYANYQMYIIIKKSELGKDMQGDFNDYTFSKKEVYPGVYETKMRREVQERGGWGVHTSITTFTVISGQRDAIFNYAVNLNNGAKRDAWIGSIFIVGMSFIPGIGLLGQASLAGTGILTGAVGAFGPGPGDMYIDYGYHHIDEQYFNFVISREYAGGSGYGCSGQ